MSTAPDITTVAPRDRAEILAQATAVFGSRSAAEKWLEQPAMALEGRLPIDLLATSVGVEIVENHLTRLEYGVYT